MKYKNGLLEARVEVPQEEFPQYNFMGLILGPRGHYISKLQERTKTKIAIKVCGAFQALVEILIHFDISGQRKSEGWYDRFEKGWNHVRLCSS